MNPYPPPLGNPLEYNYLPPLLEELAFKEISLTQLMLLLITHH